MDRVTPVRRVATGFALFGMVFAVAWVGYLGFGCHPLDSLYMVVITIFGIGYGEFCPTTDEARLFTVFVIVAGTLSVLFTFGGVIQMMTEGELHRVLDQRRKTRDIAGLTEHIIICGFNHIGQVLAQQLKAAQRQVVIVDEDGQELQLAEELGYRVCQGDPKDEKTLSLAGVERAKALATVLPDDAQNLFITLTARGLNREMTILARGDVPATEKKLRQAGADHIILPAAISGMRMANLITQPSAIDFLRQSGEREQLNEMLGHIELQIDELTVSEGSALDGLSIGDIDVSGKGAFIVVAVRRAGGEVVTHPAAEERVRGGDVIIVLGHQGDIPQFARRYDVSHPSRYRTGARG
ncbi:MAG: potassium channel protein [Methylotetracoccus sp.]